MINKIKVKTHGKNLFLFECRFSFNTVIKSLKFYGAIKHGKTLLNLMQKVKI